MEPKQIIMNFTMPPSLDDISILARNILEIFPEELQEHCADLTFEVDDFPDETIERDLDLDDPYDLVAFYRSGKQLSPGIEKKSANDDDILMIYRRPLLDMWCETGEDLTAILRQVMIEEIARHHEFSDDDIDELSERHYQALL